MNQGETGRTQAPAAGTQPLQSIAVALAAFAALGGAASLLGWFAGIYRLTDWVGTGISIKANAALSALISGLSLLLVVTRSRRRSLVRIAGALVGLIGGLTLFEHVSGWNLGIDQLLVTEVPGARATAAPGRMGPPASLSFVLIGMALVLTTLGTRARAFVPALGIAVMAISLLSLTGYLYGAEPMYAVPRLTGISVQMAFTLFAVGLGLVVSVPEQHPVHALLEKSASGLMARRLLPVVFLLPIALGWLRVTGQNVGLYDSAFGTAIRTVVEVALLAGLLWLTIAKVRTHENAFDQSERRLSQTLASITDGFVAFDEQWRYVFVNDEATRLMQKSRPELIGKAAWEVFPEWTGTEASRHLRRASAERVSVEYEDFNPVMRRWFASKAYPTEDGGVAIFFRDVTERKLAADAAARRSEQLQKLAHISTRLIGTRDIDSVLSLLSVESRDLIGAGQAAVALTDGEGGSEPAQTVSRSAASEGERKSSSLPDPQRLYSAIHRTGRPLRFTEKELESDEVRRDIGIEGNGRKLRGLLAAPLVGRNGNHLGLVQLADRTDGDFSEDDEHILVQLAQMGSVALENVRLYDELRGHAERLRDADRRKDEFLAMLAHELRNPLAAISNAAQITKRSGSSEHREWSQQVIESQVKNLARMIDDLLDVSRITRGKIELRRQHLRLATIIGSAVESVRPLLEERKHRFDLELDAGDLAVLGDPTRLEQVLVNLLSNAVKYTEAGGRIGLTVRGEDDGIVIRVDDTGIGMAPELISRAFELFAQGDRTIARSEGGLGIGLTLVKRLVEMHGGSVTAESAGLGQGSRFTVRLPRANRTTTGKTQSSATDPSGECRGFRILVVDDNADTASGLARLLKLLGNDVRMAHSGPAALLEARSYRPDIVLLDIGLPGMDGYEVARSLRREGFDQTVIIAVSGYGDETAQQRSRQSGFDHHLVKPVDLDSLVALIRSTASGGPTAQSA